MRRRQKDFGLPKRVYARHGSYYLVQEGGRWRRLCRVSEGEARMHAELARALADSSSASYRGDMPERIDEFLRHHLPALQPGTQTEYRRMFGVVKDAFREYAVAQVRPRDVAEFLLQFAKKPTARRAYRARLSSFFSWAEFQDHCRGNPCQVVKLHKPPVRDRYVSDVEFAYAAEALVRTKGGLGSRRGRMMRALFDLAYLVGQRATDVRSLRWSDVTDEGIRFKPSKTAGTSGAKVIVPRTVQIEEVLARLRGLRANNSPFVITKPDGSQYTASALRSAWRRARPHALAAYLKDCAANAIEPMEGFLLATSVKDLRAKSLSDGKRSGYSIEQLSVMAAHASVATTLLYFKEREAPVSQVVLKLPQKSGELDTVSKKDLDNNATDGGK